MPTEFGEVLQDFRGWSPGVSSRERNARVPRGQRDGFVAA
jgi:hypothetical protein